MVLMQLPSVIVAPQAQNKASGENYVAGELLVKFKTETAQRNSDSIHERIGARVIKEFSDSGWQHVSLPEGLSVSDAIRRYKEEPGVAEAQPNFVYRINLMPNDPQIGSLYGMMKINAPIAWNTTTGDSSVVVVDIDTGIDYNHEDLAANVWTNPGEIAGNGVDDDANGYVDDIHGYDFNNMDSDPFDGNDHGSHTAGTIGAVGDNGTGVAGVNWDVKIIALKTHTDIVGASTSVMVISAFNYATMMKNRGINIRVTSSSWGGPPESGTYDQALKDAIDATGRAEILNVFAAGNDDLDNDLTPTYPGSYNSPSILAVAASDSSDNKASFSSYGLTAVDVAAPGVNILSTVPGGYASFSGTSMATPHTAGAAALLSSAHPSLSAASIKATLMNTVDVLPQWSGVTVTGGRINVANAIQNPTVCTFGLSQTSKNFPVEGGSGTFNVTAGTNCGSAAFSSQPWAVVTSNPNSGNGPVAYTVAPNNTLSARSATLNVGGQIYAITQAPLVPTSATVSVGGRVTTPDGTSIPRATVTMTDGSGNVRQAITNPFGYYRFDDVETGELYIFDCFAKGYEFEAQAVVVLEEDENRNFSSSN
jgi:subtilisin family serine protease